VFSTRFSVSVAGGLSGDRLSVRLLALRQGTWDNDNKGDKSVLPSLPVWIKKYDNS